MAEAVDIVALRARTEGHARNGTVTLRDFDQGVVETLGGKVTKSNYYVDVPGVLPPPGSPGVPIFFAYPEDIYEKFKLPCISVSRDDISPAMQRWHPGLLQYRAAAPEALVARSLETGRTGYDRSEEHQQAVPFDFTYSLTLMAFRRGNEKEQRVARNQANSLFMYAMKIFAPYSQVAVRDSLGDLRLYSAFNEAISPLDDLADIGDRTIQFILSIRVEGELDLSEPDYHRTVLTRKFTGEPL